MQSKRLPMVNQVRRGTFSQGSWIGEMQQASDKSVIISEILDPRTKNLLSMSKISDYVLSNELVSMALAMVAEDQQINDVLEELFADEVFLCLTSVKFWGLIALYGKPNFEGRSGLTKLQNKIPTSACNVFFSHNLPVSTLSICLIRMNICERLKDKQMRYLL